VSSASLRPTLATLPTFDEVKAYVKDRLLAYKVPKSIELIDEIPRSESMKGNRGRLIQARQTRLVVQPTDRSVPLLARVAVRSRRQG
jgi:acyl-coenzyme A synthetase/AMP-(fatty) acid ligase